MRVSSMDKNNKKESEMNKIKMELYNTDYVIYWIDSGEFEFEKHNYPFVYATCSVEENLEEGMENNRDVLETWIPTTELPKDKQSLLIKMISEAKQ